MNLRLGFKVVHMLKWKHETAIHDNNDTQVYIIACMLLVSILIKEICYFAIG